MEGYRFITSRAVFVIMIISAIFTQHIAAQTSVSGQITTKLDVAYSSDSNPLKKLDIYFPGKSGISPILIHFHGGGWELGDKSSTKDHGVFYAAHGILFVSVNYRLSPDVKHPAHIEDCAAAVAWVFKNLRNIGGDANRAFISGHSAGAHLVALLATDKKYLQKYGLDPQILAGVIPVDTASFNLISRSNEMLVKPIITQAFGTDPETLKSASPYYNISDKTTYPKFLILTSGNRESAVTQSEEFAEKLKSAGCNVQFIIVDNHSHRDMNLGMADSEDPVGKAILGFILN